MLILTINDGELLQIGDAKVKVLRIRKSKITLGIQAPQSIEVLREKLIPGIQDGSLQMIKVTETTTIRKKFK